jgi:hypothetical protein
MYARLQSLVNRHSMNFLSGNISALLPFYDEVVPVYIAGNRVTLHGRDQVAATLEHHFIHIRAHGFSQLQGRLVALSLPRNQRFQATIDWTYRRKTSELGPGGRTKYFCRMDHGMPVIEMMEYPHLAFESACEWYAGCLEPELLTGT